MKADEFVKKLNSIATSFKTLYVLGGIGSPLYQKNKKRYTEEHCVHYNGQESRKKKIESATSDTFAFDCVCLIKAVLWGWNGDTDQVYGGAIYLSNNVPDIGANEIINVCSNVSTNFSHIEKGELLWKKGHVGIYIGNGLAVECTPAWSDGVQITSVNVNQTGYNTRTWTKHGKLPWIEYPELSDLEVLVAEGVITTPEYWEKTLPTVKHLPELIHNMAERLKR